MFRQRRKPDAAMRRLRGEIARLRGRLQDMTDTLEAIRAGAVDAVIVRGPEGAEPRTIGGAERPYRQLIEQMQDGAVMASRDGCVLYANRRFAEMVGRPLPHLIGTSLAECLVGTDDSRAVGDFFTAATRETVCDEFRLMAANAGEIPVVVAAVPLADGLADSAAGGICLVVTDLTRHRMQERLRESEERLRMITDSLPAFIGYIDREQRFQFNNRAFGEWYGLSRNGFRERHIRDIVGQDFYLTIRPHLEAALAGREIRFEAQQPASSGGIRIDDVTFVPHTDDGRHVLGVYVLVHDISQLKRTAETLQQANRQLQLLTDTASELLISDDPLGFLHKLYGQLALHLGLDAFAYHRVVHTQQTLRVAASRGLSDAQIDAIREWPMAGGVFGVVTNTGKPFIARELPKSTDALLAPIRELGWRAFACYPLTARGAIIGTLSFGTRTASAFAPDAVILMRTISQQVAVALDRQWAQTRLQSLNVTLEQRVFERTVEADRRAEQLRQMAAELTRVERRERERLAATLHDHLQQLQVAAKMRVGNVRARATDDHMRRELETVHDLLSQAIDASRSLAVELSPPILQDEGLLRALEWLGRWMLETHRLGVAVSIAPEAEPLAQALAQDAQAMLFQAVREFLFNVVKHANVDVARVAVSAPDNAHLAIAVIDGGDGFDPRKLAHTAENGDGNGDGEGFGLSSVRERIEAIDGRFEVESAPGRGASFRIRVPAGPRPLRPAVPPSSELRAPAAPGISTSSSPFGVPVVACEVRVLLADDHAILRGALAALLAGRAHIKVVGEAADGTATIAQTRELRPDAVVIGASLANGDGIEIVRALAADFPELRLIALAPPDASTASTALRDAGATAILAATASPSMLLDAIEDM